MNAHDPDNWNEAQREQYRHELEAMAELLLDIYLYNRRSGVSKSADAFDTFGGQP
jgi:hypothetical protein